MTDLLGRAVYVFDADQRPLDRAMTDAKTKVDRAGAQMQTSIDRRMTGIGKSMGQVGSSMTRHVTVPIIGIGAASVKMAADFDAAMERVHTQAGASQRSVNQLKGEVLDLAKHSAQSPLELANALYRLEGAGFRGAKAMTALKSASQLAAVGNANVEDTAKTLTQVLKPGIKGITDFHDAVAQINATVGAGDMRLQQLVDALGTGVVTSAKQAGLSFKDVTGALAVFGDETNNVSGWSAQFATALHFLTNPTTKAAGALQSIGLQSNQLAMDMQKPNGLVRALRDLQDHLDQTFPKGSGHELSMTQQRDALEKYRETLVKAGVSSGQLTKDVDKYQAKLKEYGSAAVAQAQTLGDIFPGGRGRVLSVLLNQVDLLSQKEHQIRGTTGEFARSVAETQETAAYKIHNAAARIQADAVGIGQALGPDFLQVGQAIAGEADKIANAFLKLPPEARKMIITGGLITAGIGPALKVLGVFTGGIGRLIEAEKLAKDLAAGNRTLFGNSTTAGRGAGTVAGVSRVATMEVGELVARNMIGGGAGGASGAVTRTAEREATVGETAAAESGVMGLLKGALSRLAGGGMIAGAGIGASQLAGSMIGGSTGKTVSREGSWASLGAGIGTMIEPGIGTAVGAGIAAGVGEGIHLIKSHDYGKQIAGSLTDGFGGAARKDLQAQLGDALDAAHRHMESHRTVVDGGQVGRPGTSAFRAPSFKVTGPSPQDVAKAAAEYKHAGQLVAGQLEAGWKGYRFQDEPTMFKQFRSEARKLPPQAQAAAAESAVAFARKLQDEGKLPAGSARTMIRQIEREFPALTRYMTGSATASVQQFTQAMDLQRAKDQLERQLRSMRGDFPQVTAAMDKTAGGVDDKAAAMVKALVGIQAHGTKPMRERATTDLKQLQSTNSHATGVMVGALQQLASQTGRTGQQAQQNLNALRQTTGDDMQSMANSALKNMGALSSTVHGNTKKAADIAGTQMSRFAQSVQDAMANGSLKTGQGMQLIIKNLNAALKQLGVKTLSPLQIAVMSANTRAATTGATHSTFGHGAATGALMQIGRHGDRGRDSIPLQFGDQGYMVGSGEQAMILNRDQQAFLNNRTADIGGLPGMFSKLTRPHYAASGGFLGALAKGGWVRTGATEDPPQPGNPSEYKQLSNNGMSFAELLEAGANAGMRPDLTQLLGLTRGPFGMPMGTAIQVRAAGSKRAYQITKSDVGSGQAGDSHYTIDLHSGIAQALGFGGKGDIEIARAGTDPNASVTGTSGAGGSSWSDLTVPKIKGSGTIADLARAVLKKVTAAANQYGEQHAPAPAVSGGGGAGPSFSTVSGPIPPKVQWALSAAEAIANRHVPYGHDGAGWGLPAYDCSSYVSTVMDAAGIWPKWAYYTAAGPINAHTQPGPGKWITIGTWGTSGQAAHTMMSINTEKGPRFFESGGSGGGPHEDSGWSQTFDQYRHPAGFAKGGELRPELLRLGNPGVGRVGYQPTQAEADMLQKHLSAATGTTATSGFVPHLASGGTVGHGNKTRDKKKVDHREHAPAGVTGSRLAELKKIAKEAKRQVPKFKAVKLPAMASVPGFRSRAMTRLQGLDDQAGKYGSLLSYLEGMFEVTGDVEPLITQADGSEVANWGSQAGPSPSGMIDPDTGQRTKGIWDRLREIGTQKPDQGTLLGVNELILNTRLREFRSAQGLAKQIGPWLKQQDRFERVDDHQIAWLSQALDLTQPMPKLAHDFHTLGRAPGRDVLNIGKWGMGTAIGAGMNTALDLVADVPISKDILEKVREYRNAQAQIERWRDLKEEIPAERKRETDSVTRRFDVLRHQLENSSSKKTYTNAELLDRALDTIKHARDSAVAGVPTTPPKKWKGDRETWRQEHARERATLEDQYNTRADALRSAAKKAGLTARLKKSDALFSLGQQEKIDRSSVESTMDAQSQRLGDLITGEESLRTSDKTWLTHLKEAISKQDTTLKDTIKTAKTSSDGAQQTLNAYLDPLGDLGLAIKQAKNIDIPTLLREAATLRGTVAPPVQTDSGDGGDGGDNGTDDSSATSTSDDTLTQLLLQQAQNTILSQAVQLAQDRVLLNSTNTGLVGSVPSFGGGGIVPGRLGQPVMIEAHGEEGVFTPEQMAAMGGGDTHISVANHFSDSATAALIGLIDTRIERNGRQVGRSVSRNLPGKAGLVRSR